jgi:hypothetical protein
MQQKNTEVRIKNYFIRLCPYVSSLTENKKPPCRSTIMQPEGGLSHAQLKYLFNCLDENPQILIGVTLFAYSKPVEMIITT